MNATFKELLIAKKAFNMVTRNEEKTVQFESLTKEEKLSWYEANFEVPEKIEDERSIKISSMSKDLRFLEIEKATKTQNFELIAKLATNSDEEINIIVSVAYEKASTRAKLAYYSRIETPQEITLPVLGGENLLLFAQFIVNNWDELSKKNENGDEDEKSE